jgi:hypothetical protein
MREFDGRCFVDSFAGIFSLERKTLTGAWFGEG